MWFFRSGSSYSFETCTTVIITPENLRVNWVWYSKYNEKWCFSPKCVFSEMDHHTALKLVPLWSSHLKTLECTEFGYSKYKEKWCFIPKCVFFSEMDHHTALKLVPLWSSHLKTSECTEVWPTKYKVKSDVLAQNVLFSEAWFIIQLWNLYHCDHQTSTTSGYTKCSWPSDNTKESDVLAQKLYVFSEMDHHRALKLVPLQSWHASKPPGALSLTL